MWTKLETWAIRRRKLYALQLKEGGSVNDHIKTMSELFAALAVHLLASSFDMLVTAQSESVPKWELVDYCMKNQSSKKRLQNVRIATDGRHSDTGDATAGWTHKEMQVE